MANSQFLKSADNAALRIRTCRNLSLFSAFCLTPTPRHCADVLYGWPSAGHGISEILSDSNACWMLCGRCLTKICTLISFDTFFSLSRVSPRIISSSWIKKYNNVTYYTTDKKSTYDVSMSACWHRNVVCWFFISCVISNVVIVLSVA